MAQSLVQEEMDEIIWESYEKSIPSSDMAIMREKYDEGWNQ
jgi:hypothetical protein